MRNLDLFLKKKTTTFYYAIKLFPKEKRYDISSLYFFLRQIDDLVDEQKNKKVFSQVKKDFFYCVRNKKKSKYEYNQKALYLIQKYKIPEAYFKDFFDTQEKELNQKINFRDFKQLDQYCYGVAGVVGLMIIHILEIGKGKEKEAVSFGNFMQMINILRDIKEDKNQGKIYLPQNLLDSFKIKKNNLIKDKTKYELMIKSFCQEIKNKLKKVNFSGINWRIKIPLLLAKNTYLSIMKKICARPLFYYHRRCQLRFFDWLFIFMKTFFYG